MESSSNAGRTSSNALAKSCFLQHQLVKPTAAILVVAVLGFAGWVAVVHFQHLRAADTPIVGFELSNPDAMVARLFSFPPGVVLVDHVISNSPAHRAGLRPGDGITAIDGRAVRNTDDVVSYLDQAKRGDLLELTIVRGGLLHNVILPFGDPARL